jgi:type II secretory pathway pseudopilin PulG
MQTEKGKVVVPVRSRARALGFTLFELILSLMVVSLFAGKLAERFVDYQEQAEKAAMEQTVGSIRSALNIRMAALIARGRSEDVVKLLEINPFTLLNDQQKNYAGEHYDVQPGSIPTGSWYYDLKARQVVYLVQRGDQFVSSGGDKAIHFKTELVYNRPLPGEKNDKASDVGGVVFRETQPYKWEVR